MKREFRPALLLSLLLSSAVLPARATGNPFVQKFQIWGKQGTQADKLNILLGYTNGLIFGGSTAVGSSDRARQLVTCMSDSMSYEQAIAMIDKHYKDHPEEWNQPAGMELYRALTIETGPCAYKEKKSKE